MGVPATPRKTSWLSYPSPRPWAYTAVMTHTPVAKRPRAFLNSRPSKLHVCPLPVLPHFILACIAPSQGSAYFSRLPGHIPYSGYVRPCPPATARPSPDHAARASTQCSPSGPSSFFQKGARFQVVHDKFTGAEGGLTVCRCHTHPHDLVPGRKLPHSVHHAGSKQRPAPAACSGYPRCWLRSCLGSVRVPGYCTCRSSLAPRT